MQKPWSIWKVSGLVYLGAFFACAIAYAAHFPLGNISDMLVQSLALALVFGWLAGVIVAFRNRLAVPRH